MLINLLNIFLAFICNFFKLLLVLLQVALGFALKSFCEYGAKSVFLHSFLEEALFDDPSEQNFCLTFHTYAVALQKQLQKISDFITDLEKRLMLRSKSYSAH